MLDLTSSISKSPVYHKVIFFIGLLILFLSIPFNVNIYDEGLVLTGAMMVKNGLLPYKDFWTIYAPGQFYLNALILSYFPKSIEAVRIVSFIFMGLTSVILYNISYRTLNRHTAIIPSIVTLFFFSYTDLWSRAIPTALFFVFLAVYYLFNYFETSKIKYAVFSGFSIGTLALFRHDMGGFLLGAIFQAVFFFSLSHGIIRDSSRKEKIFYGLKNALYFGIAAFWVLPFAIYFLVNIPLENIWDQLIITPATVFREYRSLPFPYPWDLYEGVSFSNSIKLFWNGTAFWIPVLTAIATVIAIIFRVRKKTMILNGEKFWKEITLFNIVLNLFNQASVRSDFEHTIPVYLGALILLINLILLIRINYIKYLLIIISISFLMSIPMIGVIKNYKEKLIKENYINSLSKGPYPEIVEPDLDYIVLKNSLINIFKIEPNARIFSCNTRHDNIYINNNLIYFELDKLPPTKYFELHPGIVTEKEVQLEIIQHLKAKKIDYIFMSELPINTEDNLSSKQKGSDTLDGYIRENFKNIYDQSIYSIWKNLEK